jgi:hypothetical protein
MSRPVVSLHGSFVLCPQCSGDGYVESGDVSIASDQGHYTEASVRLCPICSIDLNHFWLERGSGFLEMPITPEIADAIYTSGNAATEQLVNMEVSDAAAA